MSSTRHYLLLTLTLLSACQKNDPNFCPGLNANNNCLDGDGGRPCTSSSDCAPPTAVCNIPAETCVQCLPDDTTACPATSPICSSDHTCQPCSAHTDCQPSLACLPTGACGDDTTVAYIDPTGTNNTLCTKAMPCTSVATALDTGRPFIKFQGTTDEAVTIDNQNVTLLADPGAKLTRTSIGVILEIRGTSRVEIYDLEIADGLGSTGVGISMPTGNAATVSLQRVKLTNNTGGGISASGGALTVSHSTVSGSQSEGISASGNSLTITQSTIFGNQAGGIALSGAGATFDITNNFIFRNGDQDNGIFGGISLGVAAAGTNRLEFNTIVDNRAAAGATRAGGVICDIMGFTASNNIIARNTVGGSTTALTAQTLGACSYPTSKVQVDVAGLGFESPDISPFNYKITNSSSAIDTATTPSSIATDHEGDTRPQGPQKDIGADELRK